MESIPESNENMNATRLGHLPTGWNLRLSDPLHRYYRYPLARLLVRALAKTSLSPELLTIAQPAFAAFAGYLITLRDPLCLTMAAIAIELCSLLRCAQPLLAEATNSHHPHSKSTNAAADALSVFFLIAGIFCHFRLFPPPVGPWTKYISTSSILLLAFAQAILRWFAAEHYRAKYRSIFEQGRDETVEVLRQKLSALEPKSSFVAHIDVFLRRCGHLMSDYEWFDHERTPPATTDHIKHLVRKENAPTTRLIGTLWAISNADAMLSLLVVTLLLNQLWLGMVFFATAGLVWIILVIVVNGWFVRASRRRTKLAIVSES